MTNKVDLQSFPNEVGQVIVIPLVGLGQNNAVHVSSLGSNSLLLDTAHWQNLRRGQRRGLSIQLQEKEVLI